MDRYWRLAGQPLRELAHESRLAHAGVAEDRNEMRFAGTDDAAVSVLKDCDLGLPSDEHRRHPAHAARPHERQRAQDTARRHSTGLPFASMTVWSANSNAPSAAATVRSPARVSPGPAACSSRAATLTASPVTNELPSRGRPTITSPVLTPIRRASCPPNSSVSRSCMASAAWSARSAWSSRAAGAPKAAMTASPANFSTVPPYRWTSRSWRRRSG